MIREIFWVTIASALIFGGCYIKEKDVFNYKAVSIGTLIMCVGLLLAVILSWNVIKKEFKK